LTFTGQQTSIGSPVVSNVKGTTTVDGEIVDSSNSSGTGKGGNLIINGRNFSATNGASKPRPV
jgi:hypothetical protein